MADELLTLGVNSGTDATNKVYEEHTVSGSVVTFSDGADTKPLKKCEVTLPASLDGYTEVDVVATGKNLLNPATCQQGYIEAMGGIHIHSQAYKELYSDYIKVKPDTTYTFSGTVSNSNEKWCGMAYYDKDKTFIIRRAGASGTDEHFSLSYRTPSNTEYVRCTWRNYSDISSGGSVCPCQFEEGNETDYEPYPGDTYTVSLGRTIYGGTGDIVNGPGVGKFVKVDMGDLNWIYDSTYTRFYTTSLVSVIEKGSSGWKTELISDIYDTTNGVNPQTQDQSISEYANTGYVYVKDLNYTDATDFKNHVTGHYIVYPLATPTDFTFTPVPIDSKPGNNTIWCEQGTNVEVTYYSEREVINNYNVTATQLTAIADAIREKKGTTNPILFEDFPDEIRTIETGGGGGVKSVEWVYTAGINGSGSTYNYTAVEAGLYLAVAIRYQNTGCSISLPDGGTTVLTSSLSSNRIQLKVVQIEANQRIQMGIYDSSHSRGGWIFKLNVTPNAIAYSRESDSYGDQSFVNQGTSNTVLSIVCTTGTNKFYKWDKTMECYITSPLTAAAHVRIMYGVDMTMPTIIANGPITGQWILSLTED